MNWITAARRMRENGGRLPVRATKTTATRRRRRPGRPRKITYCPKCGKPHSAREMRTHACPPVRAKVWEKPETMLAMTQRALESLRRAELARHRSLSYA